MYEKKYEKKDNCCFTTDWGIYKLNEEEKNKYGNNYALSPNIFSKTAIRKNSDEFLSNIRDFKNDKSVYKYADFFETQKEACMQVKLYAMQCKIDRIECLFSATFKSTLTFVQELQMSEKLNSSIITQD